VHEAEQRMDLVVAEEQALGLPAAPDLE
jgi:hypothetical protein